MILALLAACGPEPLVCAPGYGWVEAAGCVAVVGADTGASDAPPDPVDLETPDPWSADRAAEAMQAGLDAGLPDPLTLGAAWTAAIDTGRSPGCPSAGYSLVAGVHGCTSASGWTFAGPAEYRELEPAPAFWLEADSFIVRPDGGRLAFGGVASFDVRGVADAATWHASVSGTFQDTAAEGWLAEGASAALGVEGDAAGGLVLDGGATIGAATVSFDPLELADGCPVAGAITTVDDLGRAYRLAPDCDGCGPVTQGGAAVGEACLDLTPLSDLAPLGAR